MARAERSAGAAVFRHTRAGRMYLLIQHPDVPNGKARKPTAGHWDFPKGHIEAGEKTEDTVRRETREETGIRRITLTPGFKETIRYFVNYGTGKRLKFVAFFLAETKQKRVTVSSEHQAYAWLGYREARKKLTYQNARRVLAAAEKFLKKYDRTGVASKSKPSAQRA
ncbi:MAG: NUDIX domain-containing protein [Candidatus Sungbacteria bacterium]|nr:NUDIX domain-containing protein [Candidatus Sungbacteria bacterium]